MPRFVILEHDRPTLHWDLMIECGPLLRTWRMSAIPRSSDHIAVEPTPDHRLIYLDYEGPISGNRGTVVRWDGGMFDLVSETSNQMVLLLRGSRLVGQVSLMSDEKGQWKLFHIPDHGEGGLPAE